VPPQQNRPDFSDYVAHFTKGAEPIVADQADPNIAAQSALQRLASILEDRNIRATAKPFASKHSVAFTECPWSSMLDHAQQYSPYGIGFAKKALFERGGGPVIYIRQDLYTTQRAFGSEDNEYLRGFHRDLACFLAPFLPTYAPPEHLAQYGKDSTAIDFTHEREWRVPGDVEFGYDDIEFVVLDHYQDMEALPETAKQSIAPGRFLMVDVYRRIEKLWPVHMI
jgi:hypothetical protein